MRKYSFGLQNEILTLLQDATSVLGMKVCFRCLDYSLRPPQKWWLHVVGACMLHKNNPDEIETCAHFAQEQTNQDLLKHPQGMIRRCPFGYTEILSPVLVDGIYAGPLFAGPCWAGKSTPPHPSLVRVTSTKSLRPKLTILNCIAVKLSDLIQNGLVESKKDRREQIIDYLEQVKFGKASIHDLAAHLNLSPTRTTHLVREIFQTSLPLLARRRKLLAAASDLVHSDQLVGEIARQYDFSDQNYFSRTFSETFGMSPLSYRKIYRNKV